VANEGCDHGEDSISSLYKFGVFLHEAYYLKIKFSILLLSQQALIRAHVKFYRGAFVFLEYSKTSVGERFPRFFYG
jgi:hypothetical protein